MSMIGVVRHIARFVVAAVGTTYAVAQSTPLSLPTDTSSGVPFAITGFTKMAATFLFVGDAEIRSRTESAEVFLRQQYRGSTIRTAVAAFRDDEALTLSIRGRGTKGLIPLLTSDAQISRDSRSIGINSLSRWNVSAGARMGKDTASYVEVQGGGELNTLLGIRDRGSILRVNGAISEVDVDPFRADLRLISEATFFARRTNGDIQSSLTLLRESDAETSLMFRVGYRALHRDWYSQTTPPGVLTPVTVIENRFENIITMDSRLLFPVTRSLRADINVSLLSNDITRAFKDVVEGLPLTKAARDLSQLQLLMTASAHYTSDAHRHSVTLSTLIRDEQNTAERRYESLGSLQLDTLREQERLRDNAQWRTQVGTRSAFTFGTKDSVSAQASASIMRYDTPGSLNNDDRDELNTYISASYTHAWSSRFSTTLSSRVQLNHLVFLKSQRSALNAWNRIIQFSPSAAFTASSWHFRPQFEVLAQYTVYDFEGKPGVPTSFSFRQLSYRDSIVIPLQPRTNVEIQVYTRVFERSELYWTSFAELPQSHNYEQFLRCLVTTQQGLNNTFGFGARYYALSQQSLTQQSTGNTLIQSFAPESLISIPLLDRALLDIRGWLEFQYTNSRYSRTVPNISFFIRTAL